MPINCDPKSLADAAKCFQSCIPSGLQSAVQTYLLCEIARLQEDVSGVPSGVILLWSGSIATIPSGWALCDGTLGTPDLRDKFIVGARQDQAGIAKTDVTTALSVTGGTYTHWHIGPVIGPPVATGTASDTLQNGPVDNTDVPSASNVALPEGDYRPTTTGHAHQITADSIVTGAPLKPGFGLTSDAGLPPYYALAYIMKL